MTADERATARRLVACKGWRWLPGMLAARDEAESLRVEVVDELGCGVTHVVHGASMRFSLTSRMPDLADPLTRLGVLQVVRDAHDLLRLTTSWEGDGWYLRGIPDDRPELWWPAGKSTEIEALAAALEAAP